MTDRRERVWRLIEEIGFCMLANRDGDKIRSRPMVAYVRPGENAIYFLTDANSPKEADIARDANVGLAFADTGNQTYVALTGHAEISDDRAKIHELWSTPAKAWWNSPDDPAIRLLRVTPDDAQYWDGPGTVVAYAKMIAAALTEAKRSLGDSAKVDL